MNWQQELLKAFEMLDQEVAPAIEYRIHYDNKGHIIMCSMQDHPESDQYIVVDKEIYDNYFRYDRVVNGQLRKINYDPGYRLQLYKSSSGFETVKNHASILLEHNESYYDTEFYNIGNN